MFVFGLLRVGNGGFSLEGENRRHLGSRLVESQPFPDPPLYTLTKTSECGFPAVHRSEILAAKLNP